MFAATSPELPQKSFRIKQDDKFFSRILSKENSMANPSFRVYYGGVSVAVPFVWESEPGTPKSHKFCETTLPPLTPPPSFYFNTKKDHPIKNKHSRSNLFHMMFQRISHKKSKASKFPSSDWTLSPSSSSSSASCSSFASSSSIRSNLRLRSRDSSFDSGAYDHEFPSIGSPTSTLCFGATKGKNTGRHR